MTDAVFEFLDVPSLSRTPETAKRLKRLTGLDASQGAGRDGSRKSISCSRLCTAAIVDLLRPHELLQTRDNPEDSPIFEFGSPTHLRPSAVRKMRAFAEGMANG
jgi:hypothetical protein